MRKNDNDQLHSYSLSLQELEEEKINREDTCVISPRLTLCDEFVSQNVELFLHGLQSHLVKAPFGNVDVAVAHLHVDPQALHDRQAVLVVPQVL